MEVSTKRIVEGADDLFWKYGVKSITMDDICKSIGMSKKTIYQHFEDKDALVNQVVVQRLNQQDAELQVIHATAKDPIDEMLRLTVHMQDMFQDMTPNLLFEIQKYHPVAYGLFVKYKEEKLLGMLMENFQWGKDLQFFREDIKIELLAYMRLQQVEWAFSPDLYKRVSLSIHEIHVQLLEHFLYGICTLKGHKLINKYKQIQED